MRDTPNEERVVEIAAKVARRQWGWQSQAQLALNAHPEHREWRSSVLVSNRVWHKLASLGLVEGRCDASRITPLGLTVKRRLRESGQ